MHERIVVERFSMNESISCLFKRLEFDTQGTFPISSKYFFQFTSFLGNDGEGVIGMSDNLSRIGL